MLHWLEEQLLIFIDSKAHYILTVFTLIAFGLTFLSNSYKEKFYETRNDNFNQKLEYKMKAKTVRKAARVVFIGGFVLSFLIYRKKKRFYDNF